MSTYLWKYYLEDDVDAFRQLLATATFVQPAHSRPYSSGGHSGTILGSPGKFTSSSSVPRSKNKVKGLTNVTLTRADINSKDTHGVTLLHHVASSTAINASSYALALLEVPVLDLYAQDYESGWTSLHRALYHGNITIAHALMVHDAKDFICTPGKSHPTGGLIKIKDREGNSPLDVFGASTTVRGIRFGQEEPRLQAGIEDHGSDLVESGCEEDGNMSASKTLRPRICIDGDELFTFGSNKNINLGFGNEDDRQYPERITLKRPDHLLRRFNLEHQMRSSKAHQSSQYDRAESLSLKTMPAVVQFMPLKIQDVQMSKLHTAVLTTDPEANLYVCGFGPGGRLGTGDEITRFNFACVYGGGLVNKKVSQIGLGQNHTVAVSSEGEVFTWGNNTFGQLGYLITGSNVRDEAPLQLLPRQIFGPLKREKIVGSAASRVHSVVHSGSALYTFGKNDGQLGFVDSDARSLEMQTTPRRVAASLFSSSISMVSAIGKATVCLLENHEVWVFANYGYTKLSFPLSGFYNDFLKNSHSSTRYQDAPNHITKICSGEDTICAMAKAGDVFTVTVSQNVESSPTTGSTTNPAKIRGALSTPQRVWSLRKSHMAVRDVDVSQNGSIIICTDSGSVWKRVKRAKIKDASDTPGFKAKDYKFSRIPGLTRIGAVRSNAFGSFAAVRKDCDVLRTQIDVVSQSLWKDVFSLLPFHELSKQENSETEEPLPRFWASRQSSSDTATIRQAILTSRDIEGDIRLLLEQQDKRRHSAYDLRIKSDNSKFSIPCHECIVSRSSVLLKAMHQFRQSYFYSLSEILTIEYDKDGNTLILFQGLDFITVLNFVLYLYTDSFADVWHHTRRAPASAARFRQVRVELMRLAASLDLRALESAVRVMAEPSKTLHEDMNSAIQRMEYFESGDVEIELNGTSVMAHSALLCQRCAFFEGLFHGRAGGRWLSSRRQEQQQPQDAIKVDLKHISPGIFRLVLQHIYADTGEELFDHVACADFDAFIDLILEVMAVANELMIDRLSQICSKFLGKHVTTRNVCQLLNAVAPCSTTMFKDAALEYLCLNLEGMLENHLLSELDDDLMLDLDEVVRQNQLACMPFAKSGRAEAELLERYPELPGLLEVAKRRKIDSMALHSRLHEDKVKFAATGKGKYRMNSEPKESPTLPSSSSTSPRIVPTSSKSPSLRAKTSTNDLMFDMDEELTAVSGRLVPRAKSSEMLRPSGHEHGENDCQPFGSLSSPQDAWINASNNSRSSLSPASFGLASDVQGAVIGGNEASFGRSQHARQDRSPLTNNGPSTRGMPWRATPLAASKLDMKAIMAQTSVRQSNLSSALSQPAGNSESMKMNAGGKVSQRERKKQFQQQRQHHNDVTSTLEFLPPPTQPAQERPVSAWRTASVGAKVSLKEIFQSAGDTASDPSDPSTGPARAVSSPSLTMRQTIPGNVPSTPKNSDRVVRPNHVTYPEQERPRPNPSAQSSPSVPTRPISEAQPSLAADSSTIQSIRHSQSAVEPSLQLSIVDILSQQQAEKDLIKEAAAKRSLQEIQEEQAFQEWWDQEEAATKARLLQEANGPHASSPGRGDCGSRSGRKSSRGSDTGRGPGRGRGRGRGRSAVDTASPRERSDGNEGRKGS